MNLDGIHHITAITGDAPRNVDFYTRVLGLRLVAKTVNQDDPTVYHLFYGDEEAQPGADLTFFEYPGAAPGRAGAGMVPPRRVARRLARTRSTSGPTRLGRRRRRAPSARTASLRFADPEGLRTSSSSTTSRDEPLDRRPPGDPGRARAAGLRGRARVQLRPDASARCSSELMGARRAATTRTFELRGERRGGWIAWDPRAGASAAAERRHDPPHRVGHDRRRHGALDRARRPTRGSRTPAIVDRHYFHSLYFREPGGVLYELATTEPGLHRRRAGRGARQASHPAAVARAAARARSRRA